MTQANRVRFTSIVESTPGTTPGSPRMRTVRYASESMRYAPAFVLPEEIRDDRMNVDPIKNFIDSLGGINLEWSYPSDLSPLSEIIQSTFFNAWTNTPSRDNDGVADSVITDVAATGGVFTVTTGAAFVIGHLIKTTGFGQAGNNGLFRITTGSATVPAVGNSLLTNEAAPAAAARIKVVGFQGALGDITATATGLGATALDFTTLGLTVGMFIKIGGTGASFRFATEALNAWVRITAIAATALTCDNLPAGWTTDSGSGKTIRVFIPDTIKNGTTRKASTYERGFLGQSTPTYIVNTGMTVGGMRCSLASRGKMVGDVTLLGHGGSQSTTSLDASPDAATTGRILAANVNVGRLAEAGSLMAGPNYVRELSWEIANNLRGIEDIQNAQLVGVNEGDFTVSLRLNTYFGSNALLTKFFDSTPSALNWQVNKDSQAMVWQAPRITYDRDGSPNVSRKNTDVMLPLAATASIDTLTSAHLLLDRFEYVEA